MATGIEILEKDELLSVSALFAELDDQLAIPAVLNRATPGTVYVDNRSQPRSALLRVHHRFYLGGQPDQAGFNQALRQLFAERFVSQAGGPGEFVVYCSSGWEQALEDTLLADLYPIPGAHEYYEFQRASADWRALLPEDFSLRAVDAALVADRRLGNLDDLLEEMISERASVEEFLERSFGYVMIYNREIITWCLSEYNLGERCEVGIATNGAFRRRGLATITGLAMVEEAQARGIRRIGWHCWSDNEGSRATAIKIGYQKMCQHPAYFATFNPAINLAIHGNIQFRRGADDEALAWFERAFKHPDGGKSAPGWPYIVAGCAAARSGKADLAFQYLEEAVERGAIDREGLMRSEALQPLHGSAGWENLVKRAR